MKKKTIIIINLLSPPLSFPLSNTSLLSVLGLYFHYLHVRKVFTHNLHSSSEFARR
jgi:hypothetical protein